MAFKLSKHTVSISEYSYGSDSASTKEDEKTIPFLRRLVDMLRENDEVISFYPGQSKKGQITLGRIVVHDRLKVESDVLPRYFNHSSFASLRRQLNYFSFTRLGKGRQRGATYCNEAVIELDDIIRLKRRSTTIAAAKENAQQRSPAMPAQDEPRFVSEAWRSTDSNEPPLRHGKKRHSISGHGSTTCAPTLVSPRSSPMHNDSTFEESPPNIIAIDLTVPSKQSEYSLGSCHIFSHMGTQVGDAEVLAGCRALLFIRSLQPEEISFAF